MIVEHSVCLVSLVATVVLFYFVVRWRRSGRWLRLMFAVIGIAALNGAAAQLVGPGTRGYLYRTVDPDVTFLECPYKGMRYGSMLARYRETGRGLELFRTFEKDWWNYFRWNDYATHPRWKLPFRPDERHNAEPVASANAG